MEESFCGGEMHWSVLDVVEKKYLGNQKGGYRDIFWEEVIWKAWKLDGVQYIYLFSIDSEEWEHMVQILFGLQKFYEQYRLLWLVKHEYSTI